jgi:tetratricopeptide (TPR) repeat protein
VLALARLFTEREGRAGEEEALVLLRSYWTEHPRDEDTLRPLMELLARRDCYQEALEYYEKLCSLLQEDGQQPDPHTQDVVEYLRARQIRRSKNSSHHHEFTIDAIQIPEMIPSYPSFAAALLDHRMADDQMKTERRAFLKEMSLGIGTGSLALIIPKFSSLVGLSEALTYYQAQIPFYWDDYFTASRPGALPAIEATILHLQSQAPYATLSCQGLLQSLLCQYHQLAADQLRDLGQIHKALKHADLAVSLAEQLQHVELLAAALYRRGLTYFDAGQLEKASRDLNDALPFARISRSQLRGMVCMEAGRFHAFLSRSDSDKSNALRLLDQTGQLVRMGELETDAGYVKLNQGRYHIGRAATFLALQHPQEALRELELAEQLTAPEYQRRHAHITILYARSHFLQQHYDQATHLAIKAFHLCQIVSSESNMADLARLSNDLAHSSYGQAVATRELVGHIQKHRKGATS